MNEDEIKILKTSFGLSHITDPDELRIAIEKKLSEMNAIDRVAIKMEIGRRISELKSSTPGAPFSPSSWSLLFTGLFFIVLSAFFSFVIFESYFSIVFNIVLGILVLIFFVMAWRAFARVIYRWGSKRDC